MPLDHRAEAERHERIRVQQTAKALRTFDNGPKVAQIEAAKNVWRHDKNEVLRAQLDGEARAWERLASAIERTNAALERRIMLRSQLSPGDAH